MSRHLAKQEVERFRQRSLSPAELISVCRHLEDCEACRGQVGDEDQFQNAFIALVPGLERMTDEEPFHLSAEQIEAYVNRKAGEVDAEIIESHLEDCPACAAGLRDLKAFDVQPTKIPAGDLAGGSANAWKRVKRSWQSPARWNPVYAVLLAALSLSLVTTILLGNRVKGLSAKVSELEQVNEALHEQVASLSELKDEFDRSKESQERSVSQPEEISVALYDDGKFVMLDQRGNLVGLTPLPARYEQLVKTMLTAGSPSIPSNIAELVGKRETIMGASSGERTLQLLSPLATAVRDDLPTFRWAPLTGAGAYSVDIFDSDSNKVAGSVQTHLTEWTPLSPLKRGRIYSWEVTAIKDGKEIISPAPPAPPAKFKVLDQESLDELRVAKRRYAKSHLVLGAICAQAGLFDEAEHEFKALLSANPNSAIAGKLSRSIQSLRRK